MAYEIGIQHEIITHGPCQNVRFALTEHNSRAVC